MDPDEARRRVLEELSRREYRRSEGFLAWLLGQIESWIASVLRVDSGGSGTLIAVLVALGAVVLLVAVLVLRRTGLIRRDRAVRVASSLRADPVLSGAELRDRARAAVDARRWNDAAVLGMRALVRDLEERTLLDVSEGMTAHEAAQSAARPFPDLRARLLRAAETFDAAAYSRHTVSPKQAEDLVRLAEYLSDATPQLADA